MRRAAAQYSGNAHDRPQPIINQSAAQLSPYARTLVPRIDAQQCPQQPPTPAKPDADAGHGERRAPLAFIIDEESSIRQFVSLILQGSGVDTIEFTDGASFRRRALARRAGPRLPQRQSRGAGRRPIDRGAEQGRFHRRRAADEQPRLRRARQRQAGRRADEAAHAPGAQEAVRDLGHPEDRVRAQARPSARRRAASRSRWPKRSKNNWVEFWYQPKIDLRRKQLAGAEAFARVLPPASTAS